MTLCPNGHEMEPVGRSGMVQCPIDGWVQRAEYPGVMEKAEQLGRQYGDAVTPEQYGRMIEESLRRGQEAGLDARKQLEAGRAEERRRQDVLANPDAAAGAVSEESVRQIADLHSPPRLDATTDAIGLMHEIDRQAAILAAAGYECTAVVVSTRAMGILAMAMPGIPLSHIEVQSIGRVLRIEPMAGAGRDIDVLAKLDHPNQAEIRESEYESIYTIDQRYAEPSPRPLPPSAPTEES